MVFFASRLSCRTQPDILLSTRLLLIQGNRTDLVNRNLETQGLRLQSISQGWNRKQTVAILKMIFEAYYSERDKHAILHWNFWGCEGDVWKSPNNVLQWPIDSIWVINWDQIRRINRSGRSRHRPKNTAEQHRQIWDQARSVRSIRMSGPFTRSGLFCRAQPLPPWRRCPFLVDPTKQSGQAVGICIRNKQEHSALYLHSFLLEKAYFSTFRCTPASSGGNGL